MQHLQQANAAGRTSPINENPHSTPHAAGVRSQEAQQANSKQTSDGLQQDRAKQLATLTAKCALAGVTLIESTDDRGRPAYVVSRWALTRQLATLDDVRDWLAQVTGVAA